MTKQRLLKMAGALRAVARNTAGFCALAILVACARIAVLPQPQPQTFSSSQKIVGTYYFYWYKWPNEHFFDDGSKMRDDALVDHFPRPEKVDYESVAWHRGEMSDIAWSGIDFILPVYWGAPGNYDKRHGGFSVRGLDTMQKARDRLLARRKPCPRIGMFYDTSTLLNDLRGDSPRGGKADLTTAHGKDVFYCTIRDYWKRLDRRHWAMLDGRPIVCLYTAAWAANFNQSSLDYVYENFERDFGVRPYIIADASWARKAKADASYAWGAALRGPVVSDVVQIGPGYDDHAVPRRSTPIRDREDGRFYEYGWLKALGSGRRIVLIETWNEMHEGTDICRSKEYGRRYMELTRRYARQFKSGIQPQQTITLKHEKPLPRKSKGG